MSSMCNLLHHSDNVDKSINRQYIAQMYGQQVPVI
jgi:hypothetical protein